MMKTVEKIVQIQAEKSRNTEQLVDLVNFTSQLFEKYQLQPEEIQWTVLINHLDEMIARSESAEKLPEIDITLFAELSKQALSIAQRIVQRLQNMTEGEKYLLAVHIENILGNLPS